MTRVPGIKAIHLIISDDCRKLHGNEGAIDKALERIKEEYMKMVPNSSIGSDTKFNIVLTSDYQYKSNV